MLYFGHKTFQEGTQRYMMLSIRAEDDNQKVAVYHHLAIEEAELLLAQLTRELEFIRRYTPTAEARKRRKTKLDEGPSAQEGCNEEDSGTEGSAAGQGLEGQVRLPQR